jgi:YggT family protein
MLFPFIEIIDVCLGIYAYFIIGQFVVSWLIYFNIINTHQPLVNTVVEFLYKITAPFYARVRRFMPDLGNVDLAPLACLLIIHFARLLLWNTIAPLLGVQ